MKDRCHGFREHRMLNNNRMDRLSSHGSTICFRASVTGGASTTHEWHEHHYAHANLNSAL